MEHLVTETWNEALWEQAKPIYSEAFLHSGGKTEKIIRNMLNRGIGKLHVALQDSKPAAMALTGQTTELLLIDYLAVDTALRGQGIGKAFVGLLKGWALNEQHLRYMVIEVESDPTPANLDRQRFWEACGFTATDYIHHYIWVPEPYRAMALALQPGEPVSADGQMWFGHITNFHSRAYRK